MPSSDTSADEEDEDDGFQSFSHEAEAPMPLSALRRDANNNSSTRSTGSSRALKLNLGLRLSGDAQLLDGADPVPNMTPSRMGSKLVENPFDDSVARPSPLADVGDTFGADPSPSLTSTTPQARTAISPFFDEADLKRGYVSTAHHAVTRTPAPTRQNSSVLPANNGMSLDDLHAAVTEASAIAKRALAAEEADSSTNSSSEDDDGARGSRKKKVIIANPSVSEGAPIKRLQTPAHAMKRASPVIAVDLSRRPQPAAPASYLPPPPPPPPPHGESADEIRALLARARQTEKRLALVLLSKATQRAKHLRLRRAFARWRALAKPAPSILDQADSAQRMVRRVLCRVPRTDAS